MSLDAADPGLVGKTRSVLYEEYRERSDRDLAMEAAVNSRIALHLMATEFAVHERRLNRLEGGVLAIAALMPLVTGVALWMLGGSS